MMYLFNLLCICYVDGIAGCEAVPEHLHFGAH